jgi:hypothetical protein
MIMSLTEEEAELIGGTPTIGGNCSVGAKGRSENRREIGGDGTWQE